MSIKMQDTSDSESLLFKFKAFISLKFSKVFINDKHEYANEMILISGLDI